MMTDETLMSEFVFSCGGELYSRPQRSIDTTVGSEPRRIQILLSSRSFKYRRDNSRLAWSEHMGHLKHPLSSSAKWRFVGTSRLATYKYKTLRVEVLSLCCPQVVSNSHKYARHVTVTARNSLLLTSREIRVLVTLQPRLLPTNVSLAASTVCSINLSFKVSSRSYHPHSNKLWRHNIPQRL